VLVGMAAGDALGAGYEFGPPLPAGTAVDMIGGGSFHWELGEWTDDTSMAMPIADAAAAGRHHPTAPAPDRIAAAWYEWSRSAPDVGVQTSAVLGAAGRVGVPTAADLRAASQRHHERSGRSGGNGSLMRTAPVALAYLDDEEGLVEAAASLSALTHWEPDAGEACVLWCLAIRRAVLTGTLDARVGLAHLDAGRRAVWERRLEVAERSVPSDFGHNGWVVEALQAAWCAITTTRGATDGSGPHHLRAALEAAVRGGGDTDTVAAIAGGLLGARHGVSAVPAGWRAILHGWPGRRTRDLVDLAARITGTALYHE
jgi:ADP-ribosylglycohydrolase